MYEFPSLFKKDASSKLRIWRLIVNHKKITSISSIVDGKETKSFRYAKTEDEAMIIAQRMWKKKIDDKGYLTENGTEDTRIYPVLLSSLRKDFDFEGAFVQPKIDGIRCLAQIELGKLVMYSKKKRSFPFFSLLKQELANLFERRKIEDLILDGELYIHQIETESGIVDDPSQRFRLISSICNVNRVEPSPYEDQIEFHIFDVYLKGVPYIKRKKIIDKLNLKGRLVNVESIRVSSLEQVINLELDFEKEGYEGAVIRRPEMMYIPDTRSPMAIKMKAFITDECEVVGVNLKSHDKSNFSWKCRFPSSQRIFSVTPFGSKQERRKQYENESLIGKLLTIRYQDEIDKERDAPRFPIALSFRDYE
jgi:ATP-dependent DNA ligase